MLRLDVSVHDDLVRALARQYEAEGYWVQADGIGHRNGSPASVGGFIPDVAAQGPLGLARIAEAETETSIYSDHTRDQWRAFSGVPGVRFEVIVPAAVVPMAQLQASIWGVRVDKWWQL